MDWRAVFLLLRLPPDAISVRYSHECLDGTNIGLEKKASCNRNLLFDQLTHQENRIEQEQEAEREQDEANIEPIKTIKEICCNSICR